MDAVYDFFRNSKFFMLMLSLYFAVSSAAACLFTERPEMGGADKPEGYVRVMPLTLNVTVKRWKKDTARPRRR